MYPTDYLEALKKGIQSHKERRGQIHPFFFLPVSIVNEKGNGYNIIYLCQLEKLLFISISGLLNKKKDSGAHGPIWIETHILYPKFKLEQQRSCTQDNCREY